MPPKRSNARVEARGAAGAGGRGRGAADRGERRGLRAAGHRAVLAPCRRLPPPPSHPSNPRDPIQHRLSLVLSASRVMRSFFKTRNDSVSSYVYCSLLLLSLTNPALLRANARNRLLKGVSGHGRAPRGAPPRRPGSRGWTAQSTGGTPLSRPLSALSLRGARRGRRAARVVAPAGRAPCPARSSG